MQNCAVLITFALEKKKYTYIHVYINIYTHAPHFKKKSVNKY